MIVAEIELRQIAVQMLLAAMLIDALHALLKQTEIALGAIGVHVATNVFLGAMRNCFVGRKLRADFRVKAAFVRMQARLLGDVLANVGPLRRNRANRAVVNSQQQPLALPVIAFANADELPTGERMKGMGHADKLRGSDGNVRFLR